MSRLPICVVAVEGGVAAWAKRNDTAVSSEHEWIHFTSAGQTLDDRLLAKLSDEGLGALLRSATTAGPGSVNLVVRREAFESIGGFYEDLLMGADLDLCLRLRALGWGVSADPRAWYSPGASLLREFRRGAAWRWLHRRHGAEVIRAVLGTLEPPPGASGIAFRAGSVLAGNRSRRSLPLPASSSPSKGVVVWTDAYPARSETFIYNEVDAIADHGRRVRVESLARPLRFERDVTRRQRIDYLEDDSPLSGALALARLAARHPVRCLTDLRSRRSWPTDVEAWSLRSVAPAAKRAATVDEHAHVHFLAGAALSAMRISRITGSSYSAIGHGYDVFERPQLIAEKLEHAKFAAAPCRYTASKLGDLLPASSPPIEVIVMGVDGDRFERARPLPGGRAVVAIGRLVEKKGFGHLIKAAALLRDQGGIERLTIVGRGPLEAELRASIANLRLEGTAEIVDAWGSRAVAGVLERADLLAMPAVIASDGDRDAMPVVVKEAMAMELPVVASNEVGLPELVQDDWGRLVAPGDPPALAGAIAEVLELSEAERAAMGARARRYVLDHCSIEAETARLLRLIDS